MTKDSSSNDFEKQVETQIRAYLPIFFENRKKDMVLLVNALNQNDFVTAKRIGHSIQGVSKSFGFPKIGEMGGALELACEQMNKAEAVDILHGLISEIQK